MSPARPEWLLKAVARMLSVIMLGMLLAPALQAQGYYQQGYYNNGYTQAGPNGAYYGGNNNWDWDNRGEASDGGEMGRSVGGSVGLAAGMVGGAALASAVVSAGAVASMGPLAVMLIGSAITLGGGWAGAKLFSHGGQALTRALGKRNTWMMIGATIGTIAAIALIPAVGPFAAAGGLVLKGLIGGLAGGVLGRLFANQLEAIATPRMLMAGMGAVLGGLAGNIPGAVAGAAGGYALGAIFDDHFFAQPGETVKDTARSLMPDLSGIGNSLGNSWDRITDWTQDKLGDGRDAWDRNWYDQDPYYQYGYQMAQGPSQYYGNPFDQGYAYDQYQYQGNVGGAYQQYRTDHRSFEAMMQSGQYSPDQIRAMYNQRNQSWGNVYGR